MAYSTEGGYPDLAAIRGWIRVPATSLSDEELAKVAGAEQALQRHLEWGEGDISDDVYQAFLRRVARHVAARNTPLGYLGLESEAGPAPLRRWDSEIERLEAPYTVPVIA